jgi:hypothetical protein
MRIWWPGKGTWTHSTPDWFTDQLAFGSGQNNGAAGSVSIQLFNNSEPAVYFYLYGLQVDYGVSGQLYAQINEGPQGTFFNNCFPVIADRGQPPGAVYSGASPSGASLIAIPWTWQGDQPTAPYFSPFPMAVIPPGYGFLIYNGFGSAALIATFWYVWR